MSTEAIDIVVKESGSKEAATNIAGVGTAAAGAKPKVDELSSGLDKLKGLLATLGIGIGIKQLLDYTESYAKITNSIKQATETTKEYIEVEQKLFDISQKTRTSFAGNAELFNSLTTALQDTGFTANDVLESITNLDKIMTASGKSAEVVKGTLDQLAFSLAKGQLDGRGLMTILKDFPDLGRAISNELGVTTARLLEMGDKGELTTKKMMGVFQSAGVAAAAQASFAKANITVSQAVQGLSDAFTRFIGKLDEAHGVTGLVASGIQAIASHLPQITTAVTILAGAWGAYKIAALAAAAATALATAGLSLIPTIAAAIGAAVVYILEFGQGIKLTADGSVTLRGVVVGTFNYIIDVISRAYDWVMNLKNMFNQLYAGSQLEALINQVVALGNAIANMYQGSILQAVVNGFVAAGKAAADFFATAYQGSILQAVVNSISDAVASLWGWLRKTLITLGLFKDGTTEIDKLKTSITEASRPVQALKENVGIAATTMSGGLRDTTKAADDLLKEMQKVVDTKSETGDWAGEVASDLSKVSIAADSTSSSLSNLQAVQSRAKPGNNSPGHWSNYTSTGGFSIASPGKLSSHPSGFATGGSFDVGGQGGTDSQLVQFMATPDERVTITTPGQRNDDKQGKAAPVINLTMNVNAKDADSFNLSRKTIVMGMQSELNRALRSMGQ